ncbi:MAG: hypothetical protein ABI903_09350 [Actinomycetota bacterium]
MSVTRRPLLVGALVAAVIALFASAALAVGTLGGPSYGSSMMGGYRQGPYEGMMSDQGQGPYEGMMGDQGQGPYAGMMGGSTMGSMGMVWLPGDGVAVSSIPAARARAATAAKPLGLHPGEVMRFDNGFYVELKDAAGKPATEVIVDPQGGGVSTEPGPAMMWNTRIGMHTLGVPGAARGVAVDAATARGIATTWLAANRTGTTIGSIDAYPGYFTIDLRRNGEVSGMMSVNASSGAIWYHTWHGAFIAMEDS